MKNDEQDRLVGLIVEHIKDYRGGEIPAITTDHVLQWVKQFDEADQLVILQETGRLLDKTYISRQAAKNFIAGLSVSKNLAGDAPKEFWSKVGFLRLQTESHSQSDMLTLLDEVLKEKFGLATEKATSDEGNYVYLDDVSFSGNQIKNDLRAWAEKNDIKDATVHVILIGTHTQGELYAQRELNRLFQGRNIKLSFWAAVRVDNNPRNPKDSEVFWPTALPNDEYVKKWEATFQKGEGYFIPRPPNGKGSTALFSSEAAREKIEQAFLKKGAYIYSLPKNPTRSMRPLGFSALRTPGFGATLVTYRNCPNNAPLVLWWGDPCGGDPLNKWKPLLPRRTRG